MRDPTQFGLSAAFDVPEPPDLTGVEAEAARCWAWCQGWRPDLWPAYAALHPVDDWAALAECLEVIRDLFAQER